MDKILDFVWDGIVDLFENQDENTLILLDLLLKTSSFVGIEKDFNNLLSKKLEKLKNNEIIFSDKTNSLKTNYASEEKSDKKLKPDLFCIFNRNIYPIEIKLSPRIKDLLVGYASDSNDLAIQLSEKLLKCKNLLQNREKPVYQIFGNKNRKKISQSMIYDSFKYHNVDAFIFENKIFTNEGNISIGIVSTFDTKQVEIFKENKEKIFNIFDCLSKYFCYIMSTKHEIISYDIMLKKNNFGFKINNLNLNCIVIAIMLKK